MREADDFGMFVESRQAALLRLAWALTGDKQLAEDLSQTALLRLWLRWSKVRGAGDPWPYLQQILVRTHITNARRRWHGEAPTADPAAELRDSKDAFAEADQRDDVSRWLRSITPSQRAVVVLRFLADLSVEETARCLNCSEGAVKSQASKALGRLRKTRTTSREVEDRTS